MSTFNAASVSTFHSMAVYSKRIAAQLPPQMPAERLRLATRGHSHARRSIPRTGPIHAAVSASIGTQRAARDTSQPLAKHSTARAGPALESRGQVALVRSHACTTLPSAATACRRPDSGRCVALALARPLKAGLLHSGDDVGAVPYGAVLDALRQVVPDRLADVGFVLKTGSSSVWRSGSGSCTYHDGRGRPELPSRRVCF